MGAKVKVTSDFLINSLACESQLVIFEREWPDGAELTLDNLLRAIELGLDIAWLAPYVLSDLDYYHSIVLPAYEEYEAAILDAKETFRAAVLVTTPVGREVAPLVTRVSFSGPVMIDRAWQQAFESARLAFKEARAPHEAVLYKAIAHALIEVVERENSLHE